MIRFAIHRPVATSMLFLALMLVGVVSFRKIPVDLLPSITYPRLTVVTTYEDLPAEDLERLVTQPLEEVVTALTGVRRVVSRTREGVSMITIEYEWGTQMDFANLHLREAVDRVAFREDFPEAAERPVILRWDPTSRPISILALRGNAPMAELTEFAEEVVKPALQQVEGISKAEVVGGLEREVLVEPDAHKMAIYGISVEQIQSALVRSNVSFPGGRIKQGPLQMSLRIDGEYGTIDEIAATDIVRSGQSPLRVADVARVIDTTKQPEGATLLGDEPVVSLLIYKEPEANTIRVTSEVDRALGVLDDDYEDFAYTFVYRDADYVRSSFTGLVQSLLLGAVLAFGVLFFFLNNIRAPIVVGLSIPVALTVTFALLYFGKVKLNLMSLGGLSLAAGMLVDNAIVVMENINRHLETRFKARPPDPASIETRRAVADCASTGAREMANAIVASTLTTIAVFFPVVYVPGIAGAFFRDQALTVTFALIISIATALLLQPMLSARVLKLNLSGPRGPFRLFDRMFQSMYGVYHARLEAALRRPRLMVLLLVVGLAIAGVAGSQLRRTLMPERASGDLRIDVELPTGTPLEETVAAAGRLAGWVADQPGVAQVFTQAGTTERTLAAMKDYTAPNTARLRVIMQPGRGSHHASELLQAAAEARLDSLEGVRYSFRPEGVGLAEILSSEESQFSLGVVADEPEEAVAVAGEIVVALADAHRLAGLQTDRVLGTPNVVVRLDTEEILRAGLDPDAIARDVRNRIAGVEATTFNEVEKRIDIAVRFPRGEREDLSGVLASPVAVSEQSSVPLRRFVSLSEERPVRELTRRNQRRMVTIAGEARGGDVTAAWEEASAAIATLDLPPSVRIVEGGERAEIQSSFRDLMWAMLLSVALVYMILAAQFESFVDPLLIAITLPIGIAGAMVAIAITGNTINILSLIGMIALLGIAVNDAIVKTDTIRRLRADGVEAFQAIVEASRLRFRPILMTSLTTMLAMLPMAIGLGGGEQLQRPLAVTIIGGLALTTSLTLFYTPVLYMLAHRVRRPDA
ncbi:MAG: efflux RND transporter permease subunit [Candidatus Krumholzibacteria bacterium]|nr:efflux RND transporter permease subunit [Candidatus Krumholzibacteria bacterium]MDH4337812.1 efflux RND transporter permease subunit [Candidatus Krumholzibacteria bacterium]MDH5271182.1 efflux RND transporter permease subunit [Candidatus Krumholzibacteria bacterium]